MNKRTIFLLLALAALWLLSGCGGPTQATPTAIPASVVRPVQPTPVYTNDVAVFSLFTPESAPQFVPTPAADDSAEVEDLSGAAARAAIQLTMRNQTPSAVAIAPGGAAIYAERGGRAVASVPVGGVLTVTGKSADGAWYAVYNDEAAYGWTPAGQLRVYGGEDLVVVEEAPDPAPIATLLAQAAQPVNVLDDLMAQMDATATQAALQPTATLAPPAATPTPLPAGTVAEAASPAALTAGETGRVSSDGRLNLRAAPDVSAAIVRKLDPSTAVTILARSADNAWLQVQLADGVTGWVAAEFVTVQ